MARLQILEYPDPRLRTRAKPVEVFDSALARVVGDMLETMYTAPGIGLAAIQIGAPKRVIVMDLARQDEEPQPRYYVNPEILWASEETAPYEEGCLSVPGLSWDIVRPKEVLLKGYDLQGNEIEVEADEILARCFQHEMDHLDGILLLERLDADTRKSAMKTIRELGIGMPADLGGPMAPPAKPAGGGLSLR